MLLIISYFKLKPMLVNIHKINLRAGVVLLDLEEKDLPGVAWRVVEQMALEELVTAETKAAVMRALLLRHRPVAQHHDRFRFVRRNPSSYTSLQVIHNYIYIYQKKVDSIDIYIIINETC